MGVRTAFLFPGQGAQQVGMMADLAEASPAARRVFDQADAILGYPLSQVCFGGPAERLDATDVSQPAILACSAAAQAAMAEALGGRAPRPSVLAGLSLGEYTALHVAEAMDFQTALRLVALRGQLMQQAADASPGGMVSIMGLEQEQVEQLCLAAADGGVLAPANFNCPGQIVVSGDLAACRRAVELAGKFGASGAVPLKVAGAFHSRLMQPAADRLADAIRDADIRPPRVAVIANVDAAAHGDPASIREKLLRQVTSPVKWEQSMRVLLKDGTGQFLEIGPGRVLAGLMRRIDRSVAVRSLNSADALARLAGELAA
jgi:[acyl-carrier-protein] S-malonyltransferase